MATRLTRVKDIKTALRAFNILENKDKNIGLHLVGCGSLKEEIKKYIDNNNLSNVIYHGYLERQSVYDLMFESDVFLLTSKYEGFCNAVVEAMYCENAVVSTDIEPIKTEVVGEDGIYFKVGDYNELAKKLKYLSKNKEEVTEKGKKLKKRAEEEFGMKKTVNQLVQIYKNNLQKTKK